MATTCDSISSRAQPPIAVSIGIIAWNEERAIGAMLESLLQQSFFSELSRRGLCCEVLCLVNGSTDRTAEVASEIFERHSQPGEAGFGHSLRVITIPERGKINAWNQFVHAFSAPDARYLFLMDADIVIHNPETLWNMVVKLENTPEAMIAVDRPRKDIEFKRFRGFRDRLSISASQLTQSASAQLCAQLYCIRADTARNIYLPKDLSACDDGFIKALVCTDFLNNAVQPARIQTASNASHTFQAYTSIPQVFRNQKRQAIGQTIVHILIDDHLKRLSQAQRARLAETLRARDVSDPDWLKRLIADYMKGRTFWRLFPGQFSTRFRRLKGVGLFRAMSCLPVVLVGCAFALCSSYAASRALRKGTTHYWPRAERPGFSESKFQPAPIAPLREASASRE